jgi:hypothetical protein
VLVPREQAIGGEAKFDAIYDADTHKRGRRERVNVSRLLPQDPELQLNLPRRHDIRTCADVGAVRVNRGVLGTKGKSEKGDSNCHYGKS